MERTWLVSILSTVSLAPLFFLSSCMSPSVSLDYIAPQSESDVSQAVLDTRRPLHVGIYYSFDNAVASSSSPTSHEITGSLVKAIKAIGYTTELSSPDYISPDSGFDVFLRLSFFSGFSATDTAEAVSAYTGKVLFRIAAKGEGASPMDSLNAATAQEFKKEFSLGKRLYRKLAADRLEYIRRNTVAGQSSQGLSKKELQSLLTQAVQGTLAAENAPKPSGSAFVPKSPADTPDYRFPTNPNAYAVVIGIEHYLGSIPQATFASRDAQAMKLHLLAMGFPERNIHLVTNLNATQGVLKAELRWLRNNTNANSTVFFYYSGHGAPDPDSREAYLVTSDVQLNDLPDTAFPLHDLYKDLNLLPAKKIIVALDSCFSGAGGRSILEAGARPLVQVHMGTGNLGRAVVLSAAAHDQISGVTMQKQHGIFTYYLLKALNMDLKEGSDIPVSRLYTYVKPRVEDASRRHNRNQSPQLLFRETDPEGLLLK